MNEISRSSASVTSVTLHLTSRYSFVKHCRKLLEVGKYSFKHISNNTFVKLDIVLVVAAKLATILQFHNQESRLERLNV